MDERTIQRIVDTVMSVLSDDDPDNADMLKRILISEFYTKYDVEAAAQDDRLKRINKSIEKAEKGSKHAERFAKVNAVVLGLNLTVFFLYQFIGG